MKNIATVILAILAIPGILIGAVLLVAAAFGVGIAVLANLWWLIVVAFVAGVLYLLIYWIVN